MGAGRGPAAVSELFIELLVGLRCNLLNYRASRRKLFSLETSGDAFGSRYWKIGVGVSFIGPCNAILPDNEHQLAA